MKALILGVNGQDGYYLHELCKAKEIEPICVSRTGNWIHGDISKYDQVESLVIEHRPDYVFNIAANSTTGHHALFENHETISTGTLNILEAVKQHCPCSKVFIVGSGVQFKNNGTPISETFEFEASSPYSIARIQSVYAARYYRSLGFKVYVGYLFHHESPYRKENHVSKMIACAVQRIAKGSNEIIKLGDISVEKEWTFAGDVARGIFTLVEQDNIFEATIGSGKTHKISEWVDQCFRVINKDWRDYVQLQQDFIPEYHCLVSDPSTINRLGWFPEVEISQLCEMMLDM